MCEWLQKIIADCLSYYFFAHYFLFLTHDSVLQRKSMNVFCSISLFSHVVEFYFWKQVLLFLSNLFGGIAPWALLQKLITWSKSVTFTITAQNPWKTEKYFLFVKSNICKNPFMHLRHFITFLLFVSIEK